jgi:hypothetical protein
VQKTIVEHGTLDLIPVQAEEVCVKGQSMLVWGRARRVSTRLWLAGTVSPTRESHLAARVERQVRAYAQALQTILVASDGWTASRKRITRVFREKADPA